jgi:hypothetical protein
MNNKEVNELKIKIEYLKRELNNLKAEIRDIKYKMNKPI